MTERKASALASPTALALDAVKRQHCPPPSYRPAAPIKAHMACTRCGSRLNFTVAADGMSSGRCVAARCLTWSNA